MHIHVKDEVSMTTYVDRRAYWCCRHHLCTPPPGTGLDIETSYICTYVPTYAIQIFSDSAV